MTTVVFGCNPVDWWDDEAEPEGKKGGRGFTKFIKFTYTHEQIKTEEEDEEEGEEEEDEYEPSAMMDIDAVEPPALPRPPTEEEGSDEHEDDDDAFPSRRLDVPTLIQTMTHHISQRRERVLDQVRTCQDEVTRLEQEIKLLEIILKDCGAYFSCFEKRCAKLSQAHRPVFVFDADESQSQLWMDLMAKDDDIPAYNALMKDYTESFPKLANARANYNRFLEQRASLWTTLDGLDKDLIRLDMDDKTLRALQDRYQRNLPNGPGVMTRRRVQRIMEQWHSDDTVLAIRQELMILFKTYKHDDDPMGGIS